MIPAILCIAIFIIGCTFFLSPNDFKSCRKNNQGPTESSDSLCIKYDAIIAISGGNTAARTEHAINLYKDGWANKIIFAGAAADTLSPSNAFVMKGQAQKAGVPSSDILVDEQSKDTNENADMVKNILASNNIKKVILTTSGYHQRRALLEFSRALKGQNITIVNSPAEKDPDWQPTWWLRPRGWYLAFSELAGIIIFHIRTGVSNG